MSFSGMWGDKFVHQVQTVGYFHRWTDETKQSGASAVPTSPATAAAITSSTTPTASLSATLRAAGRHLP